MKRDRGTPGHYTSGQETSVLPIIRIFAEIRNFRSPWKSPHIVFQLHEKKILK